MLTQLLLQVAVAVSILLSVALAGVVGRDRLSLLREEWKSRLRTSAPAIALLLAILLLNRIMRQQGRSLSQEYGVHMTEVFYTIEGEFVLLFQAIASPEANAYFSISYVYGYVFLLIFPVVAYAALPKTIDFRRLLIAYSLNYAIGLVFYILFIAYGPRNVFVEELTQTMLYDNNPQVQYLTTEVNRNTNVFPSLHTSLSATVATFAYQTRSTYPRWFPIAVCLSISIMVSTMYLGIHWGIDVLAGLALAGFCVSLSTYLVDRWSLTAILKQVRERVHEYRDTVTTPSQKNS
ncbi:phosphatase PAP2 family protein [Natrialba taiwanensis]|uniref:PA-phosphatase-like phosphoesterase n=1 Tax=Natrialba taiwanensis DSM 12281 TaxID=1230458 RepID=L9ZIW5_9EURY|nr:phosphatase PAP2 family protein [Natrialba taiwanensis]ELY85088.1 PA-phosphatase-like phosphoesterase [Natrialba taiwanensis DSM 12281]